ncbi:uncharacterized protein STEHIDRAFT_162856 [Stereum hirsutum FP-91666 SS1]|uniref:Uncharacterized protein n=1 Tax=Stereum hirsutum (strain FP-91666) TaxID=721885 RepID=R7RYN7_STEHR|nr:uncharacterized protein STEHIDRAFT_162856 [Stereum hirsutum FP-91666 SS1]EIM80439.1 hypothetical protein STEHIDRAFT_162856 [Stereum hirsutum FP-91666 SS1]
MSSSEPSEVNSYPASRLETSFFETTETFDDIWHPRPTGPFSIGDVVALGCILLSIFLVLILVTLDAMQAAADDVDLGRRESGTMSLQRLTVAFGMFFICCAGVGSMIRRTNGEPTVAGEIPALEKLSS